MFSSMATASFPALLQNKIEYDRHAINRNIRHVVTDISLNHALRFELSHRPAAGP